MTSAGVDMDLAVQRRLQRGVNPAFTDPLQVRFGQRHVDDVQTICSR